MARSFKCANPWKQWSPWKEFTLFVVETFDSSSFVILQDQDTSMCLITYLISIFSYRIENCQISTRVPAVNTRTIVQLCFNSAYGSNLFRGNANVLILKIKLKISFFKQRSWNKKTPQPFSGSVSSQWIGLGVWGKRPQMTEKFFCLSLCSLCCNLPHFFSFTPLWLSAWPQTLTVKEIEPPPSPPPPPLPHSVSLCFTNWSHSESTGIKTKRDIPPFFPTSPWPHTRSRTHVYWVSVCECVYVCVCVRACVCSSVIFW